MQLAVTFVFLSDCKLDVLGIDYRGTINVAASGASCRNWNTIQGWERSNNPGKVRSNVTLKR